MKFQWQCAARLRQTVEDGAFGEKDVDVVGRRISEAEQTEGGADVITNEGRTNAAPGRCTSAKALTAVLIASPPYFGLPDPQIVEALSGLAAL